MMKRPKICPVRREPSLSNFSTIFQKGTDGINEVSRLKNDNFTVRPGMHVHVCYRKNYIRTPGVSPSSAEVFYRKARLHLDGLTSERTIFTVVVLLQGEIKNEETCNASCKNREVDKAVHQANV